MKSKIFWGATVVIFVVALLSAIKMNRGYNSEAAILFLPKDATTLNGIDGVIKNAQSMTHTLSFYDEMSKYPDVSNPVKDQPARTRKGYWDAKIHSERIDGSNMLRIDALDQDKNQATITSQAAASTLITMMSRYYNIRTELDMRIADGPYVTGALLTNLFLLVVYSLLAGIFAGLLTFFISSFLPEPGISSEYQKKIASSLADIAKNPIFSQTKKDNPATKDIPTKKEVKKEQATLKEDIEEKKDVPMKPFSRRMDMPEVKENAWSIKPEELEKKSVLPTPATREKEIPSISFPEKKSSAPGNLPIADDEAVQIVQEKLYANGKIEKSAKPDTVTAEPEETKPEMEIEKKEEETASEPKKDDIFREATPEEVKERLNKLLSGKL